MENKLEHRFVIISLYVGAFLLVMGLITLTKSLALPNDSVENWYVALDKVVTTDKKVSNLINRDNEISMTINLTHMGEEVILDSAINNKGDKDAILSELKITDLSQIEIGHSAVTNKTYTLADYVTYRIVYAEDNKENGISIGDNIALGDIIHAHSRNILKIIIQFKGEDLLNADALNILKTKSNNGTYSFALDLDFKVVIQEL